MTSFRIETLPFDGRGLHYAKVDDPRLIDWPVVYLIHGEKHAYVGETTRAVSRMREHLKTEKAPLLKTVRVVVDERYNKSAALDLEAYLIKRLSGDRKFELLNGNHGLTESDYFDRPSYHADFRDIFDALRTQGIFTQSLEAIENSELFKYSPYKSLSEDQRDSVLVILEQLFADLRDGRETTTVVQGRPGTGKTIVAIYLMKLISDIQRGVERGEDESDVFAGFFTPENQALLAGFRSGLVVPLQDLRATIKKVFKKTYGLKVGQVLGPFEVGRAVDRFDLLIVDETHRLERPAASQQLKSFKEINHKLFEGDEIGGTQLDWMRVGSRHRIFMVDADQSIRPSDLPAESLHALESEAEAAGRHFMLKSQMRVNGGEEYVDYIKRVLAGESPPAASFEDYDFRLFDDFAEMRDEILRRNREFELARLVAGYAWEWKSAGDKSAYDIEIDGIRLQWNNAVVAWIASPTSADEVGSIHTVQGHDLNYAGVIIGNDLRYDPTSEKYFVDRDSYFDKRGKRRVNNVLGEEFTDEDLLAYILQIYGVLLTRGIRGTYVYACDDGLRERLRDFIPTHGPVADLSWRDPAVRIELPASESAKRE